MKKTRFIIVLLLLCLLLAGCSRAGNPKYAKEQAGFVDGVWHGMTFAYIILWDTFFSVDNNQLYAGNNVGYWYNCGFGCIAPFVSILLWGIIGAIGKSMADA